MSTKARQKPPFFQHGLRTKPKNRTLSRRMFLGSLGAAGIATPFLPLLSGRARAGGEFPVRLILLFSANGTIHENWVPTGNESDFQLSPILSPLEPFKDQLVVIDGLRQLRPGPGDDHQKGMGMLWTGNALLEGGEFAGGNGGTAGWGGGISIDQEIANSIGAKTAYKSLEFGVQTGGASVWSRMSYAGSNQPIAPEDSPTEMFDRLFGDLDIDTSAIEKLKAERRSVIDLVKGDLETLTNKYGTDDRIKVEAHLDAIRAIEQRNDLAVPACEVPSLDLGVDHQANDNFPAVSRLQIDLLVMALACDLSRVASLQWSASVSGTRFNWVGVPEGHHDLSHLGDGDASMVEKITTINTWYAGEVAYLLQKLSEVPEGSGTMLDNTLVVWGNELSRGNSHGNQPMPFVLAGGAGGRVTPGRFLSYDDVEHNRLLVSIGQIMGLDSMQSFGDADPASGGLPGL